MIELIISFIGIASGQFAELVDNTMLNLALPTISNDLNIDLSLIQWIPISFVLATSSFLLPMGKLADIYSSKKIYLIGLIIFGIFVTLAGRSEILITLILFKSLQGIGSAAIQSNVMAMIIQLFQKQDRGTSLGIFMSIIGIGSIASPVIGGYIIDNFGWRGIFNFVSIITILGFLFSIFIKLNNPKNTKTLNYEFDWQGTVLSTISLSSLIISISMYTTSNWNATWLIIGIPMTVIFLFLFILWEKHNKLSNPLIDLKLFDHKSFSLGSVVRFLSFIANSPIYYLSPFLLIDGYGLSSSKTGIYILPGPLMMAISGPIAGKLSDKMGSYFPRIVGAMCLSISVSLYLFATILNKEFVMVAYAFQGLGMGIFGTANTSYIFTSVKENNYGSVNAFLTLTRTSGNIIGISISTALVLVFLSLSSNELNNVDPDTISYISSISKAFILPTLLSIITFILTISLKDEKKI
ncbi:MAG: hypothetical protein CL704_03120 [Chloroflexi bacterium]|nr:hypothetical protein [Chloroflexota bacterium]